MPTAGAVGRDFNDPVKLTPYHYQYIAARRAIEGFRLAPTRRNRYRMPALNRVVHVVRLALDATNLQFFPGFSTKFHLDFCSENLAAALK